MLGRAGVDLKQVNGIGVTSEGTREPVMALEQREAIYLAWRENCRAGDGK